MLTVVEQVPIFEKLDKQKERATTDHVEELKSTITAELYASCLMHEV